MYDISRPGGEHLSVYREQLLARGSEFWPSFSRPSKSLQIFFKWKQEMRVVT